MTADAGTPLLQVRGLRKRFGALVATDDVDLQLQAGEVHALIGPNGAGKTTLVAQLGGQLPSDAGSVHLAGTDITRWAPHRRARAGLLRSFQITRLLRSLSVQDNMVFALQAVQPGAAFLPWRIAATERALQAQAREQLTMIGLNEVADQRIEQLSHGQQRVLEVGLSLASGPRLILLDEPMAGLGAQESQAMCALIERLRGHCAVLLIEHDVQAVFQLADRVSVLVGGRVIASGAPDTVRKDASVVAAYLGDAEDGL
jgi:branched-chain amino acid transport system ATP-binding protein